MKQEEALATATYKTCEKSYVDHEELGDIAVEDEVRRGCHGWE